VANCRLCLRIFEWRLLIFRLGKRAASMAEVQQASVPIESVLMPTNAGSFSALFERLCPCRVKRMIDQRLHPLHELDSAGQLGVALEGCCSQGTRHFKRPLRS
jgi:hypothetical protein